MTMQGATASRPGPVRRLLRLIGAVLLSALLGPAIGGLLFYGIAIGYDAVTGNLARDSETLIGLLIVIVAAAYYFGLGIAAFTGLVAGIWSFWREPGAIVVGIAAIVGTAGLPFVQPGTHLIDGKLAWAGVVVTAVISAMICRLIIRPLLRSA